MSTSSGRCFSNAAISGALQDVWPPTIALCFVAITALVPVTGEEVFDRSLRTRSVLSNHFVNGCGLNIVDYIVACPGYEMAIREYLDIFLWISQHLMVRDMLCTRCLLYLCIPLASSRISLLYRKRGLYNRCILAGVGMGSCMTLKTTLLACGAQDEGADDLEKILYSFSDSKNKVAGVFHHGKSTAAPGTRMVVRSTEDNTRAKCARCHHFISSVVRKGVEETAMTYHEKCDLGTANLGAFTSNLLR
jgi:hypothetical protein